jgi:hypothetical protein
MAPRRGLPGLIPRLRLHRRAQDGAVTLHRARVAPRLRVVDDRLGRDRHTCGQPDGHSKIETTKNIYGHLFAQDRAFILKAMNQAVSPLHAHENTDEGAV